jgi:hypothetical protein
MPNLLSLLRPTSISALSMDQYLEMLQSASQVLNQSMTGDREQLDPNYSSYVANAYQANGVVFACMLARQMLLSEARFVWQQVRRGRPGDLFGTPDLALLEEPEPGQTTGDLLAMASVDADLAGTAFIVRRPGRLKRLRPDWTTIVLGSHSRDDSDRPPGVDVEFLGVIYQDGGPMSKQKPETYLANEVAIFAPIKDPFARYRGMSTITAVRREIMADSAATLHKLRFFENAATPNMIIKVDRGLTLAKAREWIDLFEQEHVGVLNAYKTAYLGGGLEADVVGKDFQQLEFKATQGAGETRIVAAFGLHPTIVPMSEGLAGSSLNAGNFGAARRLIADKTLRPWWRNFAGSMQRIIPAPPGSRLWYDTRDIPFLAEDVKDAAEVMGQEANAVRTLTDGGYEPASVIDAVTSGDLRRLTHAGYLPVQVQPIKPGDPADARAMAIAYTKVGQPVGRLTLSRASGDVVATHTFWPMSGPGDGLHIESGLALPADHELVSRFPALFTPAA